MANEHTTLAAMAEALHAERTLFLGDKPTKKASIAWATTCMCDAYATLEAHGGEDFANAVMALHAKQ